MPQSRMPLDELMLAQSKERRQSRYLRVAQAHLPRPATTGRAALAFVEYRHASMLSPARRAVEPISTRAWTALKSKNGVRLPGLRFEISIVLSNGRDRHRHPRVHRHRRRHRSRDEDHRVRRHHHRRGAGLPWDGQC